MALNICILGAGITALSSALALQKYLPEPKPQITIYEIRKSPSTIGGAINLTPKALRYLDHLGLDVRSLGVECRTIDMIDLYTGATYATVDWRGKEGKGIGIDDRTRFCAARVLRHELQQELLHAIEKHPGVKIVWGKVVQRIEESESPAGVRMTFSDGEEISCDLLLGCDGIHSATRTLLIEPGRQPTYTGVAGVMATTTIPSNTKPRWGTTALVTSRRGSLMTSYYERSRSQQYMAAIMETEEVADRLGWRVRGSDQASLRSEILERFNKDAMPELAQLVEAAGEWSLYPVYKLPPGGTWASESGRCILMGDAAHAMPPQGESTGICIEDAVVFARAMMHHKKQPLSKIYAAYEGFRRPQVDAAYREAVMRWENVKDSGAIKYKIRTTLTSCFLWWIADKREKEFSTDYSDYDFHFGDERE